MPGACPFGKREWKVTCPGEYFSVLDNRTKLYSGPVSSISDYEATEYYVAHRSSMLAAPVQMRWAGTVVQDLAISTIASASSRPKPNLWLKWNPAPFVRQPSSTGLVSLAVLTTMCCTSRQVSLLLKQKTHIITTKHPRWFKSRVWRLHTAYGHRYRS